MRKSVFLPFAMMMLIVFLVSAACGLPFIGKDAEDEEPQVMVVTATPEGKDSNLGDENEDMDVPSDDLVDDSGDDTSDDMDAAADAQPFYLEEFDGNLDKFSYDVFYLGDSDPENASIYNEDSALKFELNDYDLYSYVFYDPFTYTDVRIDLEAENLATNNNSVTLFCRYDPDLGWYEYNIDNDGEWTLYYYDAVMAKNYVQLYDGGSTAINMGRDTNVYTMICQGKELSLYINGEFTHSFEHKDLKEGAVGLGVSSYSAYPVKINVNWLEISEP